VAAVVAALLVAAPLLALPLSFLSPSGAWAEVAPQLLPRALRETLLLAAGVGAGTLLLGGSLAVLVSFYDFPGRRVLEWALVLPLAMPGYVLAFVLLGQVGDVVELRTPLGGIVVLSAVLYPYVYLLARAAFVGQSRSLLEAARSLGHGYLRSIARVALPLARPALAAGVALAVMEAVADFGTVNLLGIRAFTDAIYRVWYGAFDRQGALQLGTMLLGLTLLLAMLERLSRRRSAYAQEGGRGRDVPLRRLRGVRAALALGLPCALLAVVFVGPVVQLVVWSVRSVGAGTFDASLVANARNSVLLAFLAAVVTVGLAVAIVSTLRMRPSRSGRAAARVVSVGYALPGSVVAVCVFMALGWVGGLFGARAALTGTLVGLVLAYVVRFMALALQSAEAQMSRIPGSLDAAARSLGASPGRLFSEVHVPLLGPGIATAALLVFVEVMKELPATVLLRPLGLDTLAVAVWEATRESLFETAAFPALLIVAVGLLPVVVLVRLTDRRTAPPPPPSGDSAAPQN
jgi:iron(III) transport system permease protein